jgi:alpha-L-arabinofuranosidase
MQAVRPRHHQLAFVYVLIASVGLVATLLTAPAAAVIHANVSVDPGNVRATMSPLGLGLHTSPYYNELDHPDIDDRLEEAGVTTLRYGGGGYADVLHWSVNRLSPWFGQAGNFGYIGGGSDFGAFIQLLDRTDNSQAVVTVNYGSALKLDNGQSLVPDYGGQAKEAAAWVAYANADASIYGTAADIPIGVDQQGNDWKTAGYWARLRASTNQEYQSWARQDEVFDPLNTFLAVDRDEPVGIEYWEIGNETFGTGYYSNNTDGYSVDYDVPYPYTQTTRRGNPDLSPAKYGQEIVEYAELMKSIDPTIKIGAVLTTPPDDWSWDYWPRQGGADNPNNNHWNPEVLAQAADVIDFAMVHWYPYPGSAVNNFGDALVEFPREIIPAMINGQGNHVGANAGLRDWFNEFGIPDTEIMITEFRYFDPENIDADYRAAADSVFVADAYATWLDLGVTSVQYLELLTKDFLEGDNNALNRGSAFHGVSMVDRLVHPGESLVETGSSNEDVRVHAAVQEDGSVAVMIINLHRTETADVAVDIAGDTLQAGGTRYFLTDGTDMSEMAIGELGNLFNVSVPARSIVTYVIPAATELAGDYNDDGIVNAADYIVWRNNLGQQVTLPGDETPGSVDEADYVTWQENFGATADTNGSANGNPVPEPTTATLFVLASTTIASLTIRRRTGRFSDP